MARYRRVGKDGWMDTVLIPNKEIQLPSSIHLHFRHLADAFTQSNLERLHLLKGTAIYCISLRCNMEQGNHFSFFQTNPTYLAKLIFQMPQNKSTKFMDSVIFTLYNYASNQREEYLLLKLFKTALQEEIK